MNDRMKSIVFMVFVCVCTMYPALARSFKIRVDLGVKPEEAEIALSVPKGAEKAAGRYFRLAETTHPDLLTHGFAALPERSKAVDADDPLADLKTGSVEDDAIQSVDRDIEYVVRKTKKGKSFVLMIVNRKNEDRTAEIELKRGKMCEPVYRRVYSEDGGKSWTTIAWQPPRAADLHPWTIEVPAKTVQTVTIGVK